MGSLHDNLLSVAEAQQRLLSNFNSLGVEEIPLTEAVGRVLAEEIFSSLDLPPFPNSSMDGFAVRAEDVSAAGQEHPQTLTVVGDIPAGKVVELTLRSGQAARIMTGAVMPAGAEAVVPVEDTDFNQRQAGIEAPAQVQIYRPVKSGENVRPRGQDVHLGESVLSPGRRLRPADIGFLGMLGLALVPVYRKPRIAVFSTGDELLPVEAPLQAGKIHDANTYILVALIEAAGGEPVNLGIVEDQETTVKAALDQALFAGIDFILSSAGVSVGAFDFVRGVVEKEGRLDFWRVNMRPGKPLAFGHYQGTPFIGLPGNPVSAFVGYEVFVRPAIAKLAGLTDWKRPVQRVRLLEPVESDGRESYLRAIVDEKNGELQAKLTGHQGSGNLRSLVQANALLIIPSGVKSLPTGAETNAWLLDDTH